MSDNISLMTDKSYQDRSHSRPIQVKSTSPKVKVPLAVKEQYPTTGGRSRLVRSEASGHDSEPVNFNKDIFETYSTTFPVESVEFKFTKYQKERLLETEKDGRPEFQGPPISILSPGGYRQPELKNDHFLSLAIFCYKYWKYVARAHDSVNIVLHRMLSSSVELKLSSKCPDFKKRNNELLMKALWECLGPTDIHQVKSILTHFAFKVFKFKEIGAIHLPNTVGSIRGFMETCMDFVKCLPVKVRTQIGRLKLANAVVKLMPLVPGLSPSLQSYLTVYIDSYNEARVFNQKLSIAEPFTMAYVGWLVNGYLNYIDSYSKMVSSGNLPHGEDG